MSGIHTLPMGVVVGYYPPPPPPPTYHAMNGPLFPFPLHAPTPTTTNQISFTLNSKPVTLANPDPKMSLNEYLRSNGYTGTKIMCGEGGCGSCTVLEATTNHPLETPIYRSINSCLRPLCSVDGATIVTVEGIGSQATGFHPIQQRVADNNGSQCGYCTPGMVMSMYSLLADNNTPTAQDIEDNFDGNICRCTGYRPILSAMKSFASDATSQHSCKGESCCAKHYFPDIEDLKNPKHEPMCTTHTPDKHIQCHPSPHPLSKPPPLSVRSADSVWLTPPDLPSLYSLLAQYAQTNTPVKLVVGNTSQGVFKSVKFDILIDITHIDELKLYGITATGFSIGSTVTLSDLIFLFGKWSSDTTSGPKSSSLPQLVTHLKRVANHPVRNVGSWAGNLMMSHDNPDFPSDVYTILAGVGATLTVGSATKVTENITLTDFLSFNMTGCAILRIFIPFAQPNEKFMTYKMAIRHQNAHALVNAAYRFTLDSTATSIVGQPVIVYGGIGPHIIRATQTEQFLVGKKITDVTVLQSALKILAEKEAYPDPSPIGKQSYRHALMTSFFYKNWLWLLLKAGQSLKPELISAATIYVRPLSGGIQSFQTNPYEFPVSEPIPKLKSRTQASGEVLYAGDVGAPQGTLFAAFVTATVSSGTLASIDASAALQSLGVVSFIAAKNIPGRNSWNGQEIFVTTTISYYGQAVGIIVADTQRHANEGAALVSLKYSNLKTPILTIEDAIAAKSVHSNSQQLSVGNVTNGFASVDHIITGSINAGAQYYFYMETHTTLVVPREGGLDVYSTTQSPSSVQSTVATSTNIPASNVNVIVGNVGGGYGGKGQHSPLAPAAAAIASTLLKKPVKIVMDLKTCMQTLGHRSPARADYKVGFMNNGTVTSLQVMWYTDAGFTAGASFVQSMAMSITDNNYYIPNLLIQGTVLKTNLPTNSTMRGPGHKEAILVSEEIMWNVAKYLKRDPQDIKELNFYKEGQKTGNGQKLVNYTLPTMWNALKVSSDFANRQILVNQYNDGNRWTKRGIALSTVRYGISYAHSQFGVIVNISAANSLVNVTHSGCELGQGISTKVAQVVAYELGIPLSTITVTNTTTDSIPNAGSTSASHTSSLNCLAAIQACQLINSRLKPVRTALPLDATWQQVIAQAAKQGVDLQAKGWTNPPNNPNGPDTYDCFVVACAEVYLDALTGETQILRVDLLFDAGISLNPAVDLGQAEGGFVQGYGNLLSEEMLYDSSTGRLITDGTWEYKPPSSKDIPIDFRVTILKNAPNPYGVLSSKATGEPPLVGSTCVLLAVKDAIENARLSSGNGVLFDLDAPATVDVIQALSLASPAQFYF